MIEIIVAIVSGVLAGGLSPFLFLRQNKDAKEIENESHQSEEWCKLYEEECKERKERDAKIDELYKKSVFIVTLKEKWQSAFPNWK